MTVRTPDLWLDWCAVVGVDPDQRDEPTLRSFAQQARPSIRILNSLRPPRAPGAPSWPDELSAGGGLHALLHRGARLVGPIVDWQTRLQVLRLLFVAVLIAPHDEGGLGLTGGEAVALTSRRVTNLRNELGVHEDAAACPRCVVWRWLEVIGTNHASSRYAIRGLLHASPDPVEHHHLSPDPRPEWTLCSALLPAIDRWGYIEQYTSMHRSSLPVVIQDIVRLAQQAGPQRETSDPEPQPPVRQVTPEEEAEILARADEVNARIEALLREYP